MYRISDSWYINQASLFACVESNLSEHLSKRYAQLFQILSLVQVERVVSGPFSILRGRKQLDRRSIAAALIAKSYLRLPSTADLIRTLQHQSALRKLCGFELLSDIPSEATFSRAIKVFASYNVLDRLLEQLVSAHVSLEHVEHVSRDSTQVEARERPSRDEPDAASPPKPCVARKRGRPKKGEERPEIELTRLERQLELTPEMALEEISKKCNFGGKRNSKGIYHYWIGYKAHIDWVDGGLPVTVVTTSASVHDSQVAIPMSRITARRVYSTYDIMDPAYDAAPIRLASEQLGHKPIIKVNKRGKDEVPMEPDNLKRYNVRTTAERGNSRLKDEFGFRNLRVRGHSKVHLHLMFGVITLFADQLLKLQTG